MRKAALLTFLTLAVALPLHAVNRSQSYITYDDGGTIVRQAEDGREIEGRVNLPLFPGDEVITARRGRVEVRMSDGNVIALDRSTDVVFKSILDSYEGDASQTVIELRYGHLAVQRTPSDDTQYVRVDTDSASYIATREAIYSVDTDRGHDQLTVFDGSVEARTPQRTSRIRAGEEAKVDEQGLYSLVNQSYSAADDFERWFLRRAERNGGRSSRYLDASLSYADYDLAANGSWVYASSVSTWVWRPRVSIGWRPYYNGHWMPGLSGSLIWVSYEPWGWVPYHYGRWGYDPFYGWVWLPGSGYSPAWVYWMYGSGYVGWAPAGWWDMYRPYYDWCYRPYSRASWDVGWGSYGRVRPGEIDLRPWTFVRPNGLVATRVDTAAITTDAIRQRLARAGAGIDSTAAISTSPARFTRSDLRDPANAVNNIVRRGVGAGGSGGTAAPDLTPFIRRDADLSRDVRDRVIRTRPTEGAGTPTTSSRGPADGGTILRGGGPLAPIGAGSVAPIGGGPVAPIAGSGTDRVWRGGDTPSGTTGSTNTGRGTPDRSGSVDRGGVVRRGDGPSGGSVDRGSVRRGGESAAPQPRRRDEATPTWRDRVTPGSVSTPAPTETTAPPAVDRSREWRNRGTSSGDPGVSSRGTDTRGSDVPRRIIERIGGARLYPGDGASSRDSGSRAERPRDSAPPRESAPPRVERSTPRESPPPRVERSSPPSERSSPPPSSRNEGSSSGRGAGSGRVPRGNQ